MLDHLQTWDSLSFDPAAINLSLRRKSFSLVVFAPMFPMLSSFRFIELKDSLQNSTMIPHGKQIVRSPKTYRLPSIVRLLLGGPGRTKQVDRKVYSR